MTKKGSALMQVLVIGLVVAAFAVMILRYAITTSANLTRTDRIMESQVIADSCMEQYMFYRATAELYGMPFVSTNTITCPYYSTGNELTANPTQINQSSLPAITFGVTVVSQ